MRHDLLADVFSAMKNAENSGKKEVIVGSSNLVANILNLLKEKGYIDGYEVLMMNNYAKYKIKLKGRINELKVVKPRLSFKKRNLIKYKSRYLPGKNVGYLIISTPKKGITTDRDIEGQEGGIIIGYIY
ncbi:MAG: 30S ribosomal protein S8 [Candidatus Aenigmarchaeota archaeon ex4484_56]|nr:MAG: 30S ribosomal protein S8 [Candidatus Aenigmarchaeota archaeon ex4484_56]